MVIDGAVTLMGSMNWTNGADANSEALNLVSSPTVAAAYAAHWRDRLAISSPFNRREDWCRVVGDIVAMAGGRLRRLFERVADYLDYLLTLTRLRILDALAGPEPETPANPEANIVADGLQQRKREQERIEKDLPCNRAVREQLRAAIPTHRSEVAPPFPRMEGELNPALAVGAASSTAVPWLASLRRI
jgi:phosphatidylserine/phosphatidylglycerophosphate/cardiolipin synthase-like enzyme